MSDAVKNVLQEHVKPAIRKEYRMMSDEERQRFQTAINRLKNSKIDGLSKYDILIVYHTPENSPGAHFGPAFLPFHREWLKQLEIAIRMEDSDVALPFWDSTLDSLLPVPKDSILWTENFLGNSDGLVNTGPFSSWKALPHPKAQEISPTMQLIRRVAQSPIGTLYTDDDVRNILSRNTFTDLTYSRNSKISTCTITITVCYTVHNKISTYWIP